MFILAFLLFCICHAYGFSDDALFPTKIQTEAFSEIIKHFCVNKKRGRQVGVVREGQLGRSKGRVQRVSNGYT